MKNEMVAIPVYRERVSPLLDVSRKYAIFEIVDNEMKQKLLVELHAESEPLRIDKLKELGVSVIICGAISDFVTRLVLGRGIRLISWVNGPVDEIIELYTGDALELSRRGARGRGCARRRRACAAKREAGNAYIENNNGDTQ